MLHVKYTTVTKVYDWGPAITKIILNVGVSIEQKSLSKDLFKVTSIRTIRDFNPKNCEYYLTTNKKEQKRTVLDVYLSDEFGDSIDQSTYVTLLMEVGPELHEGSPLNFNYEKGIYIPVETEYEIELKPGKSLKDINGKSYQIKMTDMSDFVGEINIQKDRFVNDCVFEYGNNKLKYAYYKPNNNLIKPLIIWLHGAAGGGYDTSVALTANKAVNLADQSIQRFFGENGAYVLVPQTPTIWMDYDGTGKYNLQVPNSNGESFYTLTLMALIEYFISERSDIDKDRVYIGGASNGGYMTINMNLHRPDFFAAAFPICTPYDIGWINDAKLESLKNIPIWFTHSKDDKDVQIYEGVYSRESNKYILNCDKNGYNISIDNHSNALVDRLKSLNPENIHYSLYDRVLDTSGSVKDSSDNPYEYEGHSSWIYVFNNDCHLIIDDSEITIFEWLSRHNKRHSKRGISVELPLS